MPQVWVLYEDRSHKGAVKDFGPHALLLACVADSTGRDRFELKGRVAANPKKGNEPLLQACLEDMDTLAESGAHVIALVDMDRIRDMGSLGTPETADAALVAFREKTAHANLTVLPLVQNIETVVRAAVDCEPQLAAKAQGALDKLPNERDRFFQAVAAFASRAVRDCILEKVPTFRELRDEVLRRLGHEVPEPVASA